MDVLKVYICLIWDYSGNGSYVKNKARYTATSCGWVDRGGCAHFPTFRLVLTDRQTYGRTDGWMNEQTDGRTDGRADKTSYRVSCPPLKVDTSVPE